MNQLLIRVGAWRALTSAERMAMLSHVSEQNRHRWKKEKSTAATVDK